MSRTNYSPSLAAVFLDHQTNVFLSNNLHFDLWKAFFQKIQSQFPNLPIHILVSKELNLILKSQDSDLSLIVLHDDVETEEGFLKNIANHLPVSQFNDPDWDEICFLYFRGISPLVDINLSQKAWERHKKFFSQYSYSENLPEGIVPYILTREFLATLPDHLPSDVHSFFLKNINQYDVDIFFVPPDLRQYRFDFRINSTRNTKLINDLIAIDAGISYEEILPKIKASPAIFRYAPSYIEWEIYRGCELECIFCPRQFISKDNEPQILSVDSIQRVIADLDSSFYGPMTICIGGNGEPLLHPDFEEIITSILKAENVIELIIETALYKNVNRLIACLMSLSDLQKQKICIIVNLTTLKADVYKKLYGKDFHANILESIDRLKSVLPNSSLHIQMIKMIEVGEEVESFFNHFEKKGINVILQKYNRFAGNLPERRVSDLTPIHREFCWHLNRDMVIDAFGNVSICKQNQKEILGNLVIEKATTIWEKGQSYFASTLLGRHEDIPAPCLNCDEWYTFNA
jgi:spiro-SPASM protein